MEIKGKNRSGTELTALTDDEGVLLTKSVGGRWADAALNRRLFYSHAPAVAMSAPATAAIGNIIWNPPDSGVLAFLGKWSIANLVTDADTTNFNIGYSVQATLPTTVTASTNGCCYLAAVGAGGSACKAYSIATITTAATPIWHLAHNTVAIAITGVDSLQGDLEGSIVIPPGYLIHICIVGTAAGTAGVTSCIMWEEVDV